MSERVTTAVLVPDEEELDSSLRPRSLDEFVGQERVKEQLAIALEAAKGRSEALDHVLLAGPPGLGKTSLAYIIRGELGVGLRSVAGPVLERKGDIAAILTSLEERDVLFVDEIHRLSRAVEEILYPALEDFRLDIVVGQGPAARTLTLDLPPFTLVGATTRTGLLTTPLRDRFGMTYRLEHYEPEELARIVDPLGADPRRRDRRRGRGGDRPPGPRHARVANRILRRVRDVAEVRHDGAVTLEVAREALDLLEVDGHGLERVDRELLCVPSSGSSTAARLASPRSRSRSARSPTRSRTSMSRTYSSSASSSGRREGVSSPSSAAPTSAASRPTKRSSRRLARSSAFRRTGLAPELELVPRGHRGELEQRPAAVRLAVAELGGLAVPVDLEKVLLHALVEPGAAEDELAEPVDERLVVDEGHALPVADEVLAQAALRVVDAAVGGQLDEIGGLGLLELARLDEPELAPPRR